MITEGMFTRLCEGVPVSDSDGWCNALYFPHGRRRLGGMFCRLDLGHIGDHWCEHQDEGEDD